MAFSRILEETHARVAAGMGVNNRNLRTLDIDLAIGKHLGPLFPDDAIKVCESGIFSRSEIDEFMAIGYDGFLIGTSLKLDGRPGEALNELLTG